MHRILLASLWVIGVAGFIGTNLGATLTGAAYAAGSYNLTGRVVQVSDGDTINILVDRQTHRIRLANIDAPETSHGSARPGQPFGEASRKHLAEHVAGKTLTLVCYEKDHYGRDICDIPVEDTTANRLQVKNGMAWANQQGGGKYLRDRSLLALEKQAKSARLGIWSEPKPVAPWEWRQICWQKHQCD
jgi:endonuclease YncB( thermonuclease family)